MSKFEILFIYRKKNQGKKLFESILFMKRHFLLSFVSVFCFFIIIKGTDAPLIWNNNILNSLFLQPQREPYIPERKKELKTFKMIQRHLESIFMFQSKIIAIIIYFSGDKSVFPIIPVDVIEKIKGFSVMDETCPCKTSVICMETDREIAASNPDYINTYKSIKEYANRILKLADYVLQLRISQNIEENLIDILANLLDDKYLKNMATLELEAFGQPVIFMANDLVDGFRDCLMRQYILLSYPMEHYVMRIEETTDDAMEDARKLFEEMQEKFPDSFERMRNFEQYNKKLKS